MGICVIDDVLTEYTNRAISQSPLQDNFFAEGGEI